jgi:hypothetical protein
VQGGLSVGKVGVLFLRTRVEEIVLQRSAEMSRQAEVSVIDLKKCPRCEESLTLSEFGVCRARKDGLNLYCKRCIRQKIAQSRQAMREYKNARVKHGNQTVTGRSPVTIDAKAGFSARRIARMLRKLSPADRVREAIRCGAETQTEIAQITKLPKDEVCDALANLLLWTREIRTQVINHTRRYFVNETTEELANRSEGHYGKRKRSGPELNPSFSSVGVLMPGRKPSAKGKRRSIKSHPSLRVKEKKAGVG